jgi:CheY-like chemotaxis protein
MSNKQALKLYAKGKKILIVDDDMVSKKILRKVLIPYVKSVEFARDGKEALERFKIGKYDIIMTDINMPNMNGIELSKEIKNKDMNQLIIVFSSSDDASFYKEIIDICVNAFIPKPFQKSVILQKVLNVLEFLSYRTLLEDLKKGQIIRDFIAKNKDLNKETEDRKKKNLEQFYEFCLLSDRPKTAIKKLDKVITDKKDVKTAQELFSYLEHIEGSKEIVQEKIDSIVGDIQCVENKIRELVHFVKNIELQMGFDKCEDIISDIARKMSIIYYAIDEFGVLDGIADAFFEIHAFFDGYRILDDLTPEEIEGFRSVEYLLADIKRFAQTVFINKTAEDVFLYDTLLKANLEQLETNIKGELEEDEEHEDEDVFFF